MYHKSCPFKVHKSVKYIHKIAQLPSPSNFKTCLHTPPTGHIPIPFKQPLPISVSIDLPVWDTSYQ